jgi:hypothetical protein
MGRFHQIVADRARRAGATGVQGVQSRLNVPPPSQAVDARRV